jgi:hypothetical protein
MKAEIKCYNLKAIAALYKVDIRTLKKIMMVQELKIKRIGKIYTVKEVTEIFECLGVPNDN